MPLPDFLETSYRFLFKYWYLCRTGYLRHECTPGEHWCPPVPPSPSHPSTCVRFDHQADILPEDLQKQEPGWHILPNLGLNYWCWIKWEKPFTGARTGALCKGTVGSFCCGLPFDISHREMGQKDSGNGRDLAVNTWSPWEVGDYKSPLMTETFRIIWIASTTQNSPILSALPFQTSLTISSANAKY